MSSLRIAGAGPRRRHERAAPLQTLRGSGLTGGRRHQKGHNTRCATASRQLLLCEPKQCSVYAHPTSARCSQEAADHGRHAPSTGSDRPCCQSARPPDLYFKVWVRRPQATAGRAGETSAVQRGPGEPELHSTEHGSTAPTPGSVGSVALATAKKYGSQGPQFATSPLLANTLPFSTLHLYAIIESCRKVQPEQ